jgi:hypothetical protein
MEMEDSNKVFHYYNQSHQILAGPITYSHEKSIYQAIEESFQYKKALTSE